MLVEITASAQIAPTIITQPVSQTSAVGGVASFSVSLSGSSPLTFRWNKNGVPISGTAAASAAYTINGVTTNHQANYTVRVSNSYGEVTSEVATLIVIVPPTITVQPKSYNTNVGATVTFSVQASGTPPLSYQWRKDGQNIASATLTSYVLSGVQVDDSGRYSVQVSNPAGAASSTNAILNVGTAPTITTRPGNVTVVVGQRASFNVTATGTPLNYYWRKGSTLIQGATNATLSFETVVKANAGTFTVQVSNFLGRVTSPAATLVVNDPASITSQPQGRAVGEGSNVTFAVTAAGTGPLRYRWRKDGVEIAGTAASLPSYALLNVQPTNAGGYDVVVTNTWSAATSQVATLTVLRYPPWVRVQPRSQTVGEGSNVIFAVVAEGTKPLVYQWRKDGTAITGATLPSYVHSSAEMTDVGGYDVVITNSEGSVTSQLATLTVMRYPPEILEQPQSAEIEEGRTTKLSVLATGTETLSFQWRKDGVDIADATQAAYSINVVQMQDAGAYCLVVTNNWGAVTSHVATLSVVRYPPTIIEQPQSHNATVGTSVDFSVAFAGTPPLSLQWSKNNVPIPGAVAETYSLTNVVLADAGDYVLVVTNLQGGATSLIATLNVGYPPVFVTQPISQTNVLGGAVTFVGSVTGTAPVSLQWQKSGFALSRESNETLTLTNLQSAHMGSYALYAGNLFGWTISSNAVLNLEGLPPWASLRDGLVAYYPFDGNASDASGGGIELANVGAVLGNDRFSNPSKSFWFDGTSDYMSSILPFPLTGPTPRTVSLWCYTTKVGSPGALVYWGNSSGVGALSGLIVWDSRVVLHGNGSEAWSVTDLIHVSKWYHVTYTYSSSIYEARLYVDGVSVPLSVAAGQAAWDTASGSHLGIGRDLIVPISLGDNWRIPWSGSIDEVRIYNRALSSNEVAQLYAYEADVPIIIAQPQARIVTQGSAVSFGVTAKAENPLSYQWSRDDVPITAATNATLFIPDVQPLQVGLYAVAISNAFTGVVSEPAALAVISSSGTGAPGFVSGQFRFGISGPAASTFAVDVSTDLQDWQPLSTNTFGAGIFQFVDPASATDPMRFYRVMFPRPLIWR